MHSPPDSVHVEQAQEISPHEIEHDFVKEEKNVSQDPFATSIDGGTQYRSLSWWRGGLIMIAETISLGILSLPSVLSRLGLVPGLILIVGIGIIATYTGYVIGQFRLRYPRVHSFADAGEILFEPLGWGKVGKEVFSAAQVIYAVFIMGSHLLTWTILMNSVTGHAACTIVWSVVGLALFMLASIPRTLRSVSWLCLISFTSIVAAVFITMVDVGVNPVPGAHPAATKTVEFSVAFNAVANIAFGYDSHTTFFTFISEFKDPRDFPKALYLLQAVDITLYVLVAAVIYSFAGDNVASPAINSAPNPLVRKIAWGIAIPTVLVAGVIYSHFASKTLYVRLFRNTRHLTARTPFSYGVWIALNFLLWLLAWVIAESIPNFNSLLSLMSALFASWFSFGLSGVFWLFLHWGGIRSGGSRKWALAGVNWGVVGFAVCVFGVGLWSSGRAIHEQEGGGSWSCRDNA
ncbi:hypothetical protein PRZ48_011512 [Zasmidium cellare]|uniref:Amino acid transporter transmembrane domain-containing protein n=1 Tax=Zasmidium cellare TaxID=395010 RepID=A0ABR0E731_ZASCE|nr:hypothetical protein PRZ48_011512 [Zasmidium cellare]